jgi:glycosyltransferase involved in cell wall biosynthesis
VINFVSHLPRDLRSGGFSALGAGALAAVEALDRVNYVGAIPLRSDVDQKVVSKLLRISGLRGTFHQYSTRRLRTIALTVERRCHPEATIDVFHGFTPWSLTRPPRAYVAWSDCTFRDYLQIYHCRSEFQARDIARIEAGEADWLARARRVAFTSRWAADNAIRDYRLAPDRVDVVGIFGEVEPPPYDIYEGGRAFAFVSTDFTAKGGAVVLEAFSRVRAAHPEASLVIVGKCPEGLGMQPGVTVAGFLRKEDPDESRRFHDILGRARAVVHPTRSDIAPHILVEAAMVGCPVIASRRFAIPEIVDDGRTGLLLDDPADAGEVARAMTWMLEHPDYPAMRKAAWIRGRERHTRARFEDRLRATVSAALTARSQVATS